MTALIYSERVAQLVLETFLVVNLLEISEADSGRVGRFVWNDFPTIDNNDNLIFFRSLTVNVDLTSKVMVSATISEGEWSNSDEVKVSKIEARDVLVILCLYVFSANHVKVHSVANWGVDPTSSNRAVRLYSVATVMYNHFGKYVFSNLMRQFYSWGWASSPFVTFSKLVDVGLKQGILSRILSHAYLRNLHMNESKLVHFIQCTRKVFYEEFSQFAADFHNVEIEALFVGSIIHSLDHSQCEVTIETSWLECCDERFRLAAEIARIVRSGFNDDLPFLTWRKHCKNSYHPLFRRVYERVKHINKDLADRMDCCIVE